MKHQVDEFISERDGRFFYSCTCGRKIATSAPLPEEGDGIPVEVAADGPGDCPTCFPESAVARLDGVALHPDLGHASVSEDEEVIAEDLGDEEVLKEERLDG
jgi:hypothetical protein